jgi:anaerobic magnesium-protoporphyrin IX monomethyl ester cyclase
VKKEEMTNRRKVILFFPKVQSGKHHHEMPLSILALFPELKKRGYSVILIDERLDRHALSTLERSLPDAICVGISSITGYQIQGGIAAAKFVRERRDVPIVWGGWHVSLLPEESVRSPYVDIVVRGQGEITFAELVRAIEEKKHLKEILGITFREGEKVIHNEDRPIISLNDLEPIPYDMIDINRYRPHFSYLSSIGCPMACGFCADAVVYKRKWLFMDPYRLADEIATLSKKIGWRIKSIYFIDNNFFVNSERVKVFCEQILKKGVRITWEALGHPHQLARLDDGYYELLRKSGCYRILTGAESGSQTILDYIGKKATVEDTLLFTKRCKKSKIIPVLSLMCGFPKSPMEDLKETILFINDVKRVNRGARIKLFFFTPYPGSQLYEEAINSGFQPPKTLEEWSHYTLTIRNMPYLDTEYEQMAVWFTNKYFPKITGKKFISWEEVLLEFKKTKHPSFIKTFSKIGTRLFKRGSS